VCPPFVITVPLGSTPLIGSTNGTSRSSPTDQLVCNISVNYGRLSGIYIISGIKLVFCNGSTPGWYGYGEGVDPSLLTFGSSLATSPADPITSVTGYNATAGITQFTVVLRSGTTGVFLSPGVNSGTFFSYHLGQGMIGARVYQKQDLLEVAAGVVQATVLTGVQFVYSLFS